MTKGSEEQAGQEYPHIYILRDPKPSTVGVVEVMMIAVV